MKPAITLHRRAWGRGFTLIELMIVVAVVAIISAVAYPQYTEHVRKANRADAQTALVELSQWMEQRYTINGFYSGAADGTGTPTLPFTTSPKGGTAVYNLTLSAIGKNSYTLQAAPISGKVMANDKCANLTLTNTGLRSQSGSGVTQADCWRR